MKKADKLIAAGHHQTFEGIRRFDADGNEFWFARDLQPVLDYAAWDKFRRVLDKVMEACLQSGQKVENHFSRTARMVEIGSGARRESEDHRLSYYARMTKRRVCQTSGPLEADHSENVLDMVEGERGRKKLEKKK